jgi:hypothetical protein
MTFTQHYGPAVDIVPGDIVRPNNAAPNRVIAVRRTGDIVRLVTDGPIRAYHCTDYVCYSHRG